MMLVQKQPTFNLSAPYSHRRHPSAPPAVVVQPTRTPGLLSLSKPAKPSPQRQPPSQQRNAKPAPKKSIQLVRAPLLEPAAEIPEKKTFVHPPAPSSPSPQSRGRSSAKHLKDKSLITTAKRSASPSLHGKPARQSSPPLPQTQQISSQAEVSTISSNIASNQLDPFLDESSPISIKKTTAPTLTSPPSGKLARRRQTNWAPHSSPSPVISKAIPVPNRARTHKNNISRSEPALSHMPSRNATKNLPSMMHREFPICDDMTEAGDASDSDMPSTPVTPTRNHQFYQLQTGPRTAPLSAKLPGTFPFDINRMTPPPKQNGRKHRRTPSEGVFNMSSDEDSSVGPRHTLNPSVQSLFGLVRTPGPVTKASPVPFTIPVTPPAQSKDEKQLEQEAAEKVAGYFASSIFQNSPSPEDLPAPLFA